MSSDAPYVQLQNGDGAPLANFAAASGDESVSPEDCYDFVLLFPYKDPSQSDSPKSTSSSRLGGKALLLLESDPVVQFEDALEDYLRATPRTEDHVLAETRRNFEAAWRAHAAGGELRESQLRVVLRELVVTRLVRKCNLQVKLTLSRDKDELLCLVRATETRLLREADRIDYKLEAREAVDPGYDFWTEEEIERDAEVLDRRSALEELQRMYDSGAIPESENQLFEAESKLMWSRRIQVLKRCVRQGIEFTNKYPAHIEYSDSERLQHLYRRRNPGRMGSQGSLLRTLDRLVLTRSIIDRELDANVLVEKGYLLQYNALHCASAGDELTLSWLRREWVEFWKVPSERSVVLRAFDQPINEVREYFGEKIAMYFAWLGFYTKSLVWPAIFGFVVFIINQFMPEKYGNDSPGLNPALIVLCSFVCLWTFNFCVHWERRQKRLAIRWGMDGFEAEQQARPQYTGTLRRSPVTNKMELYYPPEKRQRTCIFSYVVITFGIACLLSAVGFIFWLRHKMVDEKGWEWGSTVCSILQALLIQIIGTLFMKAARALNDAENWKTDTEYEDNLIFKTFLFQLMNNYAALAYTAFIKRSTYGCDNDDCMGELQSLLITIFIVRMGMNFVELGLPLIKRKAALRAEEKALAESGGPVIPMSLAEEESKLDTYDDTFSDYAEMILQYGLVSLFVAAFPLGPTLALIENILEIRVDAFKLCYLVRRPAPSGAEDIGTWGIFLQAMSTLALLSNSALVIYTTNNLENLSETARALTFAIAATLIVVLKFTVAMMISDTPQDADDAAKRHEFIEDVYVRGLEDDDDDDEAEMSPEAAALKKLMRAQAELVDEAGAMANTEQL